tara:strand:- start:958 stop:1845 length:888 start_codon:yes stop_codon:yes gene_type:complete
MSISCGYVALVGRPNVGKSTLLNALLRQKLSITSRKPQTTRQTILGINTTEQTQFIYVDTPGIHSQKTKKINQLMNKAAVHALKDVDVIVLVVEGTIWREEDERILDAIKRIDLACVLVINKIDKMTDKRDLFAHVKAIEAKHNFVAILPLSAKTGHQLERLEQVIEPLLPDAPHLFDADQLTNRSTKFLCAELVREKIFRLSGQEIPYATSVEIESFVEEPNLIRIHALIWLDKPGHKRIIIGDKGQKLKEIATSARLDMEKLLDKKVFLQCWCKVKTGWSDDERMLKQLGYEY